MGCISEEAKGGRGCSLSRRRHLLLLRSVLPSLPPSLAHSSISSSPLPPLLLFSPPPSLSLFFYSPFPPLHSSTFSHPRFSLFSLRFASFVPPRRNEEIETRHSKKTFHEPRTRAPELRTFPVNLAGGRAFVPIQQARWKEKEG